MPESRFIAKINQTFDWISVDADRNMLQCAPKDWGNGVVVHAKEQRISDPGRLQEFGRAQIQLQRHPIQDPRIRLVEHERTTSASGSSTRPSNTSAAAHPSRSWCAISGITETPTRLFSITGAARTTAAARPCNVAAGEKWSKVIGPILVYVNSLDKLRRGLLRPTSTRWPPLREIPPCRPPGRTTRRPCGRMRCSQAKKENGEVALRLGQRRGLPAQE